MGISTRRLKRDGGREHYYQLAARAGRWQSVAAVLAIFDAAERGVVHNLGTIMPR
jgi:hypothetical protein